MFKSLVKGLLTLHLLKSFGEPKKYTHNTELCIAKLYLTLLTVHTVVSTFRNGSITLSLTLYMIRT